MCGIYGSIGFAPDEARIDMVAHRGPDGRGWLEFPSSAGPVALGHRRLAIIDISDAGLQPMVDPCGRYSLILNGEIYNYIELREELKARGEIFQSETDSEVLLRAYSTWGEAALDRLRGMFAFLIWDNEQKILFAARDRYGIKPLYFATNQYGIAFASEIKQLLGLPGIEARMNIPRVHDFLDSGIADHTPETMFANIMQLRGGECARVGASRRAAEIKIRRWYDVITTGEQDTLSEKQAAEQFHDLLEDAVRIHLRSDVPVGSCLSGGIDSSSIVCLMANMLGGNKRVHTVSASFAEKSVDEKPFMDEVIARANTIAHFVRPSPDDLQEQARKITWHQDEPFATTSIFAQWCVFEEAKRAGLTVMLDGQGADEQLAGYHGSFHYYLSDLARQRRWSMLARSIVERRRFHGTSVKDQFSHFVVPLLPPKWQDFLRRSHVALFQHDWMNSEILRKQGNPAGGMAAAMQAMPLPAITDIGSLCITLTQATNLALLLHFEDRNSMAHSIEARVPFVDHPLVEFSLKLGSHHKIVGGDTKRVLRRGMKGIIPDKIRHRRDKLGFTTPEQAWFKGPMKNFLREGVEATLKRYPGLLNDKAVRAMTTGMLDGNDAPNSSLWRIANLGIWGETFAVQV